MKAMKRIAALCLILCLLCQPVLAAGRKSGFSNFTSSRTYEGQFTDVSEDAWYYQDVVDAYELGLMDGTSSDAFSPDGTLSVAETLALASRLLSVYSADEADFSGGSLWYTPYVNYAAEHGLITRGQFPDYTLSATRAEAAAILGALPAEMLSSINNIQNNAIPDVSPGSGYYDAVYCLYRAGILTGSDQQGSFLPDTTISRGETAAIAVRLAVPSSRSSMELTVQPVSLYADNGDRISVDPGQAAAYEAQGWQRAPFTVPADGGAEAILNAATLRPKLTGTQALDDTVEDIFARIFTDGMTTYEKVKACYDYLIENTSYERKTLYAPGYGPYQSFSDYLLVLEAQDLFSTGTGACDDYSAAFLVMARRIGLSCYVYSGETSKAGGGWTAHAWNVITVGGVDYVFDAQVEDNIAAGGKIQYYRFCKTFDQVSQIGRAYV